MGREDRIRKIQIGLIRSLNSDQLPELYGPHVTDEHLLWDYGNASRPMAEALHDVLQEMVEASFQSAAVVGDDE
jgi:hypothetical protein